MNLIRVAGRVRVRNGMNIRVKGKIRYIHFRLIIRARVKRGGYEHQENARNNQYTYMYLCIHMRERDRGQVRECRIRESRIRESRIKGRTDPSIINGACH